MNSPRILAFDTSGPHCAVVLLIGENIAASRCEDMGRGQAERLFPMINEVLADEGAVWEEFDAIGVGVGPGNFTGIRIAVSAARGLALSLGIPAVGVSGFEALRYVARSFDSDAPELVSLPAAGRHADVVLQLFRGGIPAEAPRDLRIFGNQQLDLPEFPERTRILGKEAPDLNWLFAESRGGHMPCTELELKPAVRLAEAIAKVAALKLARSSDVPRPSPLYIRPADAAPASDPPPVILP